MTPRPILKTLPPLDASFNAHPGTERPSDADPYTPYTGALPFSSSHFASLESPHVHFPPTPTLTQLGMTHSSYSYDRKPIEVLPNSLVLPGRGERDIDHGYFHPMRYTVSDADVDYTTPSSSGSVPILSNPTTSTRTKSFENEYELSHSYDSSHVFEQSSQPAPSDTTLPDIPTSISISIHFSCQPTNASPPSSTLTRKRDPNEAHCSHHKKKTRKRSCTTGSRLRATNYMDCADGPSETDLSGHGLGLGFGHLSKRTTNTMDSDYDDEYDSSASSSRFSSFFEPAPEGCLGGF